jgi:predicted nicotinamide N-methyase
VLELGAGTGACGIIIAAAAAARGILIDALLTDRNDAALNLAASSAAAVATQVGCTIRTARYAFGDDAGCVLSLLSGGDGGGGGSGGGGSDSAPGCDVGRIDPPDLVVVSDVLYAPESAAPLVATLQQLLVRAGGWQGKVTPRRVAVTDSVDALPVHPHEIFEGLGVHGFRPRASTVCCPKF